ncbi:unnamed protein product [Aphanomyces euteiches]
MESFFASEVTGLVRSQKSADALIKAGAKVHKGDLEDLDTLRAGASTAGAVVHLGFNSDFSNFVENCKADGRVIRAMGGGLVQSKGFMVITSGLFVVEPSCDSTPDELVFVQAGAHPRSETEVAGAGVAVKGVRVVVVRLPLVYGREDHAGFTSLLISISLHWLDAAVLLCLVVDKATEDGPAHAVAEEGVLLREIAEVVGKKLNIPVVGKSANEANEHFGWLARFMHNDKPRSSQWTQEKYGWKPQQGGLLSLLDSDAYIP